MAIAPRNIEGQIEVGIKALLDAESYITSNEIPVRLWFDTDDDLVGHQIIVHTNSATPSIMSELGEAKEYEVQVDLLQYIHNAETELLTGTTNTIYEFLVGFAEQTTIATIQAKLTKLTVNGKNTMPYAEQYDERYFMKVASFTIFIETS